MCAPMSKPWHRMWTDKEASIKALARFMGSSFDREILEKTAPMSCTNRSIRKNSIPALEGLKTVIDDIAERDPRAKTVKPEQFIDASLFASSIKAVSSTACTRNSPRRIKC